MSADARPSTGARPAGERPALALVYHPQSFSVFQLAQAAQDLCSIVWVVDDGLLDSPNTVRVLRKLGTVVDVSGMDAAAAASALAEFRPDGILTFKDGRQRFTADLAQHLGLPFHAPDVAARLTDKHAQRVALRDGGVPVPGFFTVPAPDEPERWLELEAAIRFPAVLKPQLDNEASRDTIRVATLDTVREAVGADRRPFVLEEYLEDRVGGVRACFADYVSVESVVSHGQVSHITVTGRFPPAEPFRESGFFIEAELSDGDRAAALEAASAALRALGIQTGCVHTEVKFTPAGARVIEVNGRIGGGVPEMLAEITDMELLRVAMRVALGEEISYDRLLAADQVGFLFYVHAPKWMRRITAVEGLEQLKDHPAVSEVELRRGPGREVDWHEGNHGYVFSATGAVADHDALEAIDRLVHTEVRISGQ